MSGGADRPWSSPQDTPTDDLYIDEAVPPACSSLEGCRPVAALRAEKIDYAPRHRDCIRLRSKRAPR